ncbi:MAG: hypothetical protein IT292_07735 [Deltaproteobacteria bacterium]|nr:hypothetical protein [Deltaproteobacteria bacterium]
MNQLPAATDLVLLWNFPLSRPPFELWFEFPKEIAISPRGDAFLPMALLSAMALGENLSIDSTASPYLL